jgi:hypothetical protein
MLNSLQQQPHKLFFTLGALTALHGLGVWIGHYIGFMPVYPGVQHAWVLIGCVIVSFLLGLFYTLAPREAGKARMDLGQLVITTLAIIVALGAAKRSEMIAGAAVALALIVSLVHATLALRHANETERTSLTLILVGFGAGIYGALLAVLLSGDIFSDNWLYWRQVSRGALFQTFPTLTVIGLVGLTYRIRSYSWKSPLLTVAVSLAFLGTYFLESLSLAGAETAPGWALRALYLFRGLIVVILVAQTHRNLPTLTGPQRKSLLYALWTIPSAPLLAAAFPVFRLAFEHMFFVSGFAWLILLCGSQAVLTIKNETAVEFSRKYYIWLGVLVFLAMSSRVSTDIWSDMHVMHLAWASLFLIIAIIYWAVKLRKANKPQ